MEFPFGQTVTRLRARVVEDPYSGLPSRSDWSDPLLLVLPGAFVASSSSVSLADEARSAVATSKSLYCKPSVDVEAGDRISVGTTVFNVPAVPESDVNPFTGWQPVVEIPLEVVEG